MVTDILAPVSMAVNTFTRPWVGIRRRKLILTIESYTLCNVSENGTLLGSGLVLHGERGVLVADFGRLSG